MQENQTNEIGKVYSISKIKNLRRLGIYASKANWTSGKCSARTLQGFSQNIP